MKILQFLLAGVASVVGALAVLPVVVLAAPFWVVAAGTRAVAALIRRAAPAGSEWHELIRFEPVIGWRPRPGLDTHARGVNGVFRVTTGEDGWRGRGTVDEADIVVIGDSFAFGYGAHERDFFANRVTGRRVKCIGANGYSMVHGLLWMERLADRLAGKLVVWLVYYGNDLHESLAPNLGRYRMPFVRESADGWERVTDHVSPDPWPLADSRNDYERLAEICTGGFLARRVFGAVAYLIEEARDLLADRDARLVVVGIPDASQLDPAREHILTRFAPGNGPFDTRLPDRRLADICSGLGVEFVTLSDHLRPRDHQRNDCHWTASGHRRVARLIEGLPDAARVDDRDSAGRTGMEAAAW
jgi:hypothetical protein